MESKGLRFKKIGEEQTMASDEKPLYEKIGGAVVVEKLVTRFYQLMDNLDGVRELREMHHGDLQPMVERLILFMTGWLGGPPLYVEKYGHPKLRRRHSPFQIGTIERDQWILCMFKSMEECQISGEVETQIKSALFNLADHMRNMD